MKIQYILLVLCITILNQAYGQQASAYFPQAPGFLWYSKTTALDSMNNRVDSLSFFTIDSFAVTDTFKTKNSHFIFTKSGAMPLILEQPYLDTLYVSLESTNGSSYFDASLITSLTGAIDTTTIDTLFGGFNPFDLIASLEGWYPLYRFAQNLNSEYLLVRKDTTINYNGTNIATRIEIKGKRVADEQLETVYGSLSTKKFVRSIILSATILPPFYLPLYRLDDTVWIAQDYWIVKQFLPSTVFDIQLGGLISVGPYNIPGRVWEVISPLVSVRDEESLNPGAFALDQNFPNPFNPATTLRFTVNEPGFVSLKVYDILGCEVADLVHQAMQQGVHQVVFNGENLASGIYYYRITLNGNDAVKQMLLLK